MPLDNCDEAKLIRQGGRDRAISGTHRPSLSHLSTLEQQAYLKGFNYEDGWETLLCPCLGMTRDQCAGECAVQDSVSLQRQFNKAH